VATKKTIRIRFKDLKAETSVETMKEIKDLLTRQGYTFSIHGSHPLNEKLIFSTRNDREDAIALLKRREYV